MRNLRNIHSVCLGLLVVCGACDLQDQESALDIDNHHVFRDFTPPGGGGGWIVNGLTDPDVTGLNPGSALSSSQGLNSSTGWLNEQDEAGIAIIKAVVECALPDDVSIVKMVGGEPMTFNGFLGLAPQWQYGPCDEDCQEWVTACLLARTNPTGQEVYIWVQGATEAVGFGDSPDFPMYEANYYGNAFVYPPELHVCKGDAEGLAAAQQYGRTCALDESECGFAVLDDCEIDAGCELSETGVPAVGCKTSPSGPAYNTLAVFVSDDPTASIP